MKKAQKKLETQYNRLQDNNEEEEEEDEDKEGHE